MLGIPCNMLAPLNDTVRGHWNSSSLQFAFLVFSQEIPFDRREDIWQKVCRNAMSAADPTMEEGHLVSEEEEELA